MTRKKIQPVIWKLRMRLNSRINLGLRITHMRTDKATESSWMMMTKMMMSSISDH